MPLTEEFIAEVDSCVEHVALDIAPSDKPADDTTKADDDPGKPAAETVVETHEDDPGDDPASVMNDDEPKGDDDGAAEPEPKPSTPAAPVTPTISDDVLASAVRAGMSLSDARQAPSEQFLRNVIASVEAAAKKVETKPEAKTDEDPLAGLPKLDPEQYEPEVIKSFETLVGVVRKQQEAIKAFQAQSEQAARSGQESKAREVEQWFDKQVEKLGKDFTEALGSGAYGALERGSPQYAKREALANQVSVLLAGYAAAGQQAPPRDDVFDAAARLVLRDEYQKLHEKKLASDLAKRSTQHIQRAGGQKTKNNPNPLEEAAAAIDEKFFSKK